MRGAQTRIMRGGSFDADEEPHEILVTIYGNRIGYKVDLDPTNSQTIIGRDLDVDIPIDDESVSRRHCRLMPVDGAWFIAVEQRSAHSLFIHARQFDRKSDTGRRQHVAPRPAARGQDDIGVMAHDDFSLAYFRPASNSCISLIIDAAVSSTERRVTSMIGQPYFADIFRV